MFTQKNQEFQEKQIAINGLQINYKIMGQGPTILILHGWGRGSDSYSDVIERIARAGYRVMVPDLPGFGKTDSPHEVWGVQEYSDCIVRFVHELGVQRFTLLGHSFGGQVALQFAVDHEDRLERLILYAAAVMRRKPDLKKRMIRLVSHAGSVLFSFWPFRMFRDIVGRVFYRLLGSGDWRYSQGMMKQVHQKVVRQDLSALAPHVTVPTLIIWGDQDRATPVEDARILKDKIPGSSLKVIPGVGHRLHREAPDIFVESILQFLRTRMS